MTPGELVELRGRLGLSQVQLAQLLGIHPLTISRWERGVLEPTPYQLTLLESFKKARQANKTIGDEIAGLLVTAGVVVALYALLDAALGGKKR